MNRSLFATLILALAPLFIAACAAGDTSPEQSGSGDSTASSGSGSSSGASTSGSGSSSGGAGGASAGGYCPTAKLGSALPASYDGSTVGKKNIVTSARLEWTDAGDDALLFVAPETAMYKVSMPMAPAGAACGASIREFGPQMNGMGAIYDSTWCPKEGAVVEIDGVFGAFEGGSTDIALTKGQELLIWVSCSYFSNPVEGAYKIMIEKI